jgi:hypothetical protein
VLNRNTHLIRSAGGAIYESEALARATLVASGYHWHRGEWRRRRVTTVKRLRHKAEASYIFCILQEL